MAKLRITPDTNSPIFRQVRTRLTRQHIYSQKAENLLTIFVTFYLSPRQKKRNLKKTN
jgi:hypothetical protein